ncbi:MAG: hypothetical protein MJ165_00735 [Alphaproteobacteria bacterium]|nr:hypothetical protein [Alphaproteobacteria bacterium]
MSISKLFTSIFAMFAIFGTNAFATPSIRQIGVATSSATNSAKSSESNIERAATTTAVKPVAKPTATTSTTTTATSGDTAARLVGVPFAAGKSSHNTKATNSKISSSSASTELNSLREQLESLQNDFVALATQNYVDQQLTNIRTEAAQAIVEAKNNMVSQDVLNQTVDNAVRDLASNETISNAMDTKIANLANQVDTKLSKKIEQPQLTSAISDAVGNLASNDTIVTLKNRVDGHDTELAKAVKKDDTTYLDYYVTTKNLASKNDITNTLGDLKFTVDQNAKQVKFSVGNDSTQHKFADIADLGGTPGCSSSVATEPDSVNRQMKVTTTNSCTNETDTKYIPYGENAKEITIEVDDGAIKWKREGESSHKIVDIADLKGQDAKEISIEVDDNAIKWKREGGNLQKLVDIADLKGQDAKVPTFKIEGENLMYKADKDSSAEFVNLGKVKGEKGENGQNGEGLTAQDRKDIEEVKTVGTYFTNGKISQDKVDGLSEALAKKLTSSDLEGYAKSEDVSSSINTAKNYTDSIINERLTGVLTSSDLKDYAKLTDVSTAKQEAIDSAKTEALNAVASEYAKLGDLSTAKNEAIDSAKQYADSTFATNTTIQNLTSNFVERSDKLTAVMNKFDSDGKYSASDIKGLDEAVSAKLPSNLVTEANLKDTLTGALDENVRFKQLCEALETKGVVKIGEDGKIEVADK